MKTVIVDDELFARQSVEIIIKDAFPDIEIAGQADSVKSAVQLIKALKPELVFLDVDLPDGSGFDVLNLLKPVGFKIIFITAHQEYALKAIKFSAFDYILKPVSIVELTEAVNRVISENEHNNQQLKLDAFFNNFENIRTEVKKIVLKTSESIHLINVPDIIRCEADNNYTTFYLANGERIIVSKGLKDYEDLLVNYGFFRVHQSHLINLKYLSRFDKREGGFVVMTDKTHVPVSQRKKQKLMEVFDGLV
jgi:two-component system LytT family response regulator